VCSPSLPPHLLLHHRGLVSGVHMNARLDLDTTYTSRTPADIQEKVAANNTGWLRHSRVGGQGQPQFCSCAREFGRLAQRSDTSGFAKEPLD